MTMNTATRLEDEEIIGEIDRMDNEWLEKSIGRVAMSTFTGTIDQNSYRDAIIRIATEYRQHFPERVTTPQQWSRTCNDADKLVRFERMKLDLYTKACRYEMPEQLTEAYSTVPESLRAKARETGRAMLKDPAVKNVCTHIAFRYARIQAYSFGNAQLDAQTELSHSEGIVRTYMAKHGITASDAEIGETSRYLATQIVEKSNSLLKSEVCRLYDRYDSLMPKPRSAEYDSALLKEREHLLANTYHTHPQQDQESQEIKQAAHGTESHETAQQPAQGNQREQSDEQAERLPRTATGTAGRNHREPSADTSEFPKTPSRQPTGAGVKQKLRGRIGQARDRIMAGRQPSTQSRSGRSHAEKH